MPLPVAETPPLQTDVSLEELVLASAPLEEPVSTPSAQPEAHLPSTGTPLPNGPSQESIILPSLDNHSPVQSPSPTPRYSFLSESSPSLQPIVTMGPPQVDVDTNPSHQSISIPSFDSHPFIQSPSPTPGYSFLSESGPSLQSIVATGTSYVNAATKPLLPVSPVHQDNEQLMTNVKNTATVYVWKQVSTCTFYLFYHSLTIHHDRRVPDLPLPVLEWISLSICLLTSTILHHLGLLSRP